MSECHMLARRRVLQSVGAIAALTLSPTRLFAADTADVTGRLARYMVVGRDAARCPPESCSPASTASSTPSARWSPARGCGRARWRSNYVRGLGGEPQASVIGASDFRTTAINAALANAMCAHSDETDDFEPVTKAHPGSSVVPAALALAEREGSQRRSADPRGRARLRPRLPSADGARARPRARHASQRRGHALDLRRARRRRLARAARRTAACASRSPTRRSRSPACGAG